MLNEEELKDAALLVFANKQDQPGAKGAGDISQALRLGELRDRNWSIMACSAVDGSGVTEGMDWLVVSVTYSCRIQHPCADQSSKPFRKSKRAQKRATVPGARFSPASLPWLPPHGRLTLIGRQSGNLTLATAFIRRAGVTVGWNSMYIQRLCDNMV
jgi:hypothetical protein